MGMGMGAYCTGPAAACEHTAIKASTHRQPIDLQASDGQRPQQATGTHEILKRKAAPLEP